MTKCSPQSMANLTICIFISVKLKKMHLVEKSKIWPIELYNFFTLDLVKDRRYTSILKAGERTTEAKSTKRTIFS